MTNDVVVIRRRRNVAGFEAKPADTAVALLDVPLRALK